MSSQVWWHLSRASGLVAWGLGLASVLWGIALATRALGPKAKAPWLLDLHRHLGGLTVLFTGIHVAALVADSYLHFGLADVLVPFASDWRPAPVAWGVIALWLLLGIEVTSLLRNRMPKRWWRRIHLLSYAVAVLTTVHLFTAGTDATTAALRWATIALAAFTLFFLLYRELGPRKAARTIPARPTRAPTPTSMSTEGSDPVEPAAPSRRRQVVGASANGASADG